MTTITIDNDSHGNLVARDESGNVLARRKRYCNPSSIHQIIADAEAIGTIDWAASQVAKPGQD
jgi:hypothetical protein